MRSEPFEPTANPGFYVPRPACELALDSLHSALRGGARALGLAGPPGAGKRMLLRVLEQRLRSHFLPITLAHCALPIESLAAHVLRVLSQEGPGPQDRGLLAAALRSDAEGRPLVLLLEQASALPAETARALGALLGEAEGALRCVLRIDGDAGRAAACRVAENLVEIPLRAPLTAAESHRLVRERLDRAQAPDAVRLRFYEERIAQLHEASGGVPGVLCQLAARVAAGDLPPPQAPPETAADAAPLPDPFGPSATTGAYQPRPATEAVLDALTGELASGRRTLLLHGPSGLGKTTLLRVLRDRLPSPFQPVELPYGRFEPDDFWSFVLFQLGAPRGDFPESSMLEVIRDLERRGRVLVLLIDEGQALPEATRTRLAAVLHHAEGSLRAVLAVGGHADRHAFAELPDAEWIGLDQSLTPAEAAAYVTGRLERFDAPAEVRARFDDGTLGALFRASRGVPRELNRLAGEIERADAGREARAPIDLPSPQPAPPVPVPEVEEKDATPDARGHPPDPERGATEPEPTASEPPDEESTDAASTDIEPSDIEPTDIDPSEIEPVDSAPTDSEPTDSEPMAARDGAEAPSRADERDDDPSVPSQADAPQHPADAVDEESAATRPAPGVGETEPPARTAVPETEPPTGSEVAGTEPVADSRAGGTEPVADSRAGGTEPVADSRAGGTEPAADSELEETGSAVEEPAAPPTRPPAPTPPSATSPEPIATTGPADEPTMLPHAERQRIAEVKASEAVRRQLSAPPVAPAASARPVAPAARAITDATRRRRTRARRRASAPSTGILPHIALATGVPAVLVVLWLWLSPVFLPTLAPEPPPVAPPTEILVHINATPWAHIEVDGRPLGVTPLGNVPLAAGPHDFRARLPDGRIVERRVDVTEARRHIAFP